MKIGLHNLYEPLRMLKKSGRPRPYAKKERRAKRTTRKFHRPLSGGQKKFAEKSWWSFLVLKPNTKGPPGYHKDFSAEVISGVTDPLEIIPRPMEIGLEESIFLFVFFKCG